MSRHEDVPAVEWMHRGADLLDHDLVEAAACYRRALAMDPSLRGAWFDLGLVHKWRRDWAECLACNRRAAALGWDEGPQGDPAYWNAGIAATALEDWSTARWAWRGFGIPITDGDGAIEEDFGPGVVRLPDGETVWGRRIDPARMVLLSVPMPESGFRCGDVVLHDGEPKGSRVAGGHEYAVFELIARTRSSTRPTVEVVVDAGPADVDQLVAKLESSGIRAENWTVSVVVHCKACSRGRIDYDHPDHDHRPPPEGEMRVGCSGDVDEVAGVVSDWAASGNRSVRSVEAVA